MTEFIRLDPPIPLDTIKGSAYAHFLVDYGVEEDLFWVCFMDETGECWTFRNRDIRGTKNISLGRNRISSFNKPTVVEVSV